MAASFERDPEEIVKLIAAVMKDHHQELHNARVTVSTLLITPDDFLTPAVKVGGYPCVAAIKPTSAKERARGMADAKMEVDSFEWGKLADAAKRALIDHELLHLQVSYHLKGDAVGKVKRDSTGRPKLKTRLHDWQLGGFADIVRRHGGIALEAEAMRLTANRHGQILMPWAAEIAEKNAKGWPESGVVGRVAGGMKVPDGIDSVTISSGAKSVTLTKESGKRIREAGKAAGAHA